MDDAHTCMLSTLRAEAGGSQVQSILGCIVNLKLAKVTRDLVPKTNKTEVELEIGAELAVNSAPSCWLHFTLWPE